VIAILVPVDSLVVSFEWAVVDLGSPFGGTLRAMRTPRRASFLSLALLAVLALTMVGHICVLPHGEDHQRAPRESPGHEHDHGDDMHVASCEGIRSAAPCSPCISLVAMAFIPYGGAPKAARVSTTPRPEPTSSPPLFLLHAALLI
jgi:hypothetical protein